MSRTERVGENLNRALHQLFAANERLFLLGEDIADPYGGAFKVSKGLSTRFPDRVIATPISEAGIVGVASGLALSGNTVIVEIMFGDFFALGLDPLLNFATKSVAMYGRRTAMRVILRCPVGGNRGYGPTHSQSVQKHLVGIPHLALFELSPFHDAEQLLRRILERDEPTVLFEPKALYPERMYRDGRAGDDLVFDALGGTADWVRCHRPAAAGLDLAVIATGGVAHRALEAACLLAGDDVRVQVLVPAQLYPVDLTPVRELLRSAGRVCVVEESTAGGTWGTEVARHIYEHLWGDLRRPVLLLNSRDSVIPAAVHLEREVLIQTGTIRDALRELAGDRRPHAPGAADAGASKVEIRVPQVNSNDPVYTLVAWLAPEGARVTAGEAVAEVETSKATEELVAPAGGVLRRILIVGADCRPGDVIGYLLPGPVDTLAPESTPVPHIGFDRGDRTGTDAGVHRLSRSQQHVAEVVTAAHREIPDAFVVLRVGFDEVLALSCPIDGSQDEPVGFLELMVKVMAGLHASFPLCFGTRLDNERVRLSTEAHVGVTLDAGNGLFVPVVKHAERRALKELADDVAGLRLKALRGTFTADELTGANIALSWNHEADVVLAQPVIPPGLVAMVSVGGPQRELRLADGAGLVEKTYINIGLAYDHRVINGREAVEFLRGLKDVFEDPQRLADVVAS